MQNLFSGKEIIRFSMSFLWAMAIASLAGCGAGGGGAINAASGVAAPPGVAASGVAAIPATASLQISATPTTIKSDNSTTSQITVTAVSSTNAVIPGATINLSADTGLLSSQTVTTGATGQATVTFSSGTASKTNRTATITATSGTVTVLLPVQIVGSTLALTSTGTSLPTGGASPVTLTITAKDAGGLPISGAAVALTQAGGGTVTLAPSAGTTDANGKLVVTVSGAATAGTATVSATAVGTTTPISFTVTALSATFGINQLTLTPPGGAPVVIAPTNPKNATMQFGDTLKVQVNAPTSNSITFATTIGSWANGSSTQPVVPVAGVATATLSTNAAGVANVQVVDTANPSLSDSLSVGMTAKVPHHISLQATPTVLPKSVGSTVGFSNLTAMVYDASGAPVGGAPVAFSIVSPSGTGGGETISPVVVFSAATTANGIALGAAPATFTSGSLSSSAPGVQVRASVVGTAIATQPIGVVNNTASSLDTAIIIGGTAGSVAFGEASKITDPGLGGSTTYSMPMSVLVADANGSPAPLGTVVNISVWPIAWSTGSACRVDQDGKLWDPTVLVNGTASGGWVTGNGGTFFNEDVNQNLILDPGEDGVRKYYYSGTLAPVPGTKDNLITPSNSYGGVVVSTNPKDLPGTVTTDANGVAAFNLTYTKSQANWIVSRIRAQTVVQGSPAVGQLDWRLVASVNDSVPCVLPPSPFNF